MTGCIGLDAQDEFLYFSVRIRDAETPVGPGGVGNEAAAASAGRDGRREAEWLVAPASATDALGDAAAQSDRLPRQALSVQHRLGHHR